jgi:sec-independent protein translocase protein TatB
MFEVGFSEMLLIAVLALVVLGPERLPRVAAQMGRWVGRARAMARQFREQLEEEASLEATTRRPNAAGASSSDYSANPSAGGNSSDYGSSTPAGGSSGDYGSSMPAGGSSGDYGSSTPGGGSSGEQAASTTGGASSDYASSPSAGTSSHYGSSTPGVSAGDYSNTPPSAGIDVSAAATSLNDEATPHTPPPEVAASTPAHEIDSNDTRHADLSQSPATAVAGEVHERGT